MIDNILRCGVAACILYFGINWIADNPKKMKMFRKEINQAVDSGIEKANQIVDILSE